MESVVYNVRGFSKRAEHRISLGLLNLMKTMKNKIGQEMLESSVSEDLMIENYSSQIIQQA